MILSIFVRDGEQMDKEAYKAEKDLNSAIKDIQITSISQKTKLISYELDGIVHTSIWRRHETWQNIFHQETKKNREILSMRRDFSILLAIKFTEIFISVRIFQGVLRFIIQFFWRVASLPKSEPLACISSSIAAIRFSNVSISPSMLAHSCFSW